MSQKRERSEYNRMWQEKNREHIAASKRKYATEHREQLLAARRKWYEDHREEIKIKNRAYREKNWVKVNAYDRQRRIDNPTRAKRHGELRKAARLEVIENYGGRCVCCGESHHQFLTVDHAHKDGNVHRKAGKANHGYGIYVWLKKHGFPKADFQLLCFNCNTVKSRYGSCPHQKPFGAEVEA